jgi:methyl-accepting chemotaxis protein
VATAVFVFAAVVAIACIVVLRRRSKRMSPHQRAVRDVLDAADALEDRLRTARAEIEAVAGEAKEDPVGEALREMLRQRLWLRDHGADASPRQLADVRQAIDAARHRIDHQLARIEEARAPRV